MRYKNSIIFHAVPHAAGPRPQPPALQGVPASADPEPVANSLQEGNRKHSLTQ